VFIADVIASFAAHADPDHSLVIKHHPLDRGYHDYTRLIRKKALEHGAQGRVFYLHDQHLPTLLEHARGVIVINSTVGFSAIHHGTPVKVCGEAIYNMQGLTFQGPLDDFWTETQRHLPSPELYHRFRQYVIHHTQYNGSFYKRLEIPGSLTGVVWGGKPESEPLFSKVPQTPPEQSAPRIA
jgi:capsular polysaccharide export protein